jgi:hypothetical protein
MRRSQPLPNTRHNVGAVVRTVVVTLALATFLAGAARAQTIYVDNQSATCSSLGPGTVDLPYCTISAAAAANKGPGITIIVKPGIYREQVTIPASGAAGSPYVFQAEGPGVVVDGSDDFADAGLWAPYAGSVWLASSVTWNAKQVFVDGARLTPSTASPDLLPVNTFRWVSGEGLYVNLGLDNPGIHQTLVGHRNFGFNMFTKSWITIDGFEVARTEDRGINMQTGCTDLVISHNRVSFANSYGIHSVNGLNVLIDGNVVSDCVLHGIGLTAGATGCTVRNNESFHNVHPTIRQTNGIHLFGAPGNTIHGNRLHDNQDTGLQFGSGSNDCVSYNNRSWNNGDHGYDHLGASGTIHVDDLAYGNFKDGFSFEGNSPSSQLYNCIAVENGLTTNEFDLWVDATSSVGFVSDYNIFWNSTSQPPIKYISTLYSTLADYQLASGLDAHSFQADPRFANPAAADFQPTAGSPAIDAANSGVPNWPATDAIGVARVDDPRTADLGAGPVTFGDRGPLEFVPTDQAPVASSPPNVKAAVGGTVSFTVTASDPDGDPITSLVLLPETLPANSGATFTVNADNTAGTFTWPAIKSAGTYRVRFVASNWAVDTSQTNIVVKAKGKLSAELAMDETNLPGVLRMSNGYPNPASSTVEFALDLPRQARVRWAVFDLQGRQVWTEEHVFAAGRAYLRWDGVTSGRQRASTGIYLVRAEVGDAVFTRRIVRF